jgi:hypothetical protein
MSVFYPSLTLGVKLRDINPYPWWKQYIQMASMNYFLNKSLLWYFMTYTQTCNKSNTTDSTSWERTAYPSEVPVLKPVFSGICVAQSLVFCVVFCRSLFVLLSFFFAWSLYCMSFFELQLLTLPFGILKLFFRFVLSYVNVH